MTAARVSEFAVLDPAGPAAHRIEGLWWFMFWLSVVVFVVFLGVLLAAMVRRHDDDVGVGWWLVGGGVVLPVVAVGAVLWATLSTMTAGADPSDAELTIDVTGNQWWWGVEYPDAGVVTANEVHIPVGVPVLLRFRSSDVIHSFWVPALAPKMDVLPDTRTTLVIEADQPGTFDGRCNEFCGLQHTNMGVVVVASPPEEFAAWLDAQARPAASTDGAGAELFDEAGCGRCHTVAGTSATGRSGPDLTHVASRGRLGAGVLAATPEGFRTWITDPHTVKPGVRMDPARLDAAQIEVLVAYLEGLR